MVAGAVAGWRIGLPYGVAWSFAGAVAGVIAGVPLALIATALLVGTLYVAEKLGEHRKRR